MSFTLPTEIVELPSKGLIYPESNPLSSGQVEIKYMTAKEEDILSNQSYIQKGIVIDKLLQSVIVTKINYDDLIIGDKNAIMVSARVLGYGKDYKFTWAGEDVTIDLSEIDAKPLDESLFTSRVNEFEYILPFSKTPITFKILTHGDETKITQELESLKKIHKDNTPELSTRLKYIITSVDGELDKKVVREFVDNFLLARDAKSLRSHILEIQPDIDLSFFPPRSENRRSIPITLNFFWPQD
jgi:uncharacterized lipoprotein YehR (DUF1307 family)